MEDEAKAKLEVERLQQFEDKLKKEGVKIDLSDDSPFDQYTTIRFLRARKLDIDAAYTMLTNHLKWRADNKVDSIIERAPKENKNFKNLERYWPGQYAGADKEGIPIWVERGGQIDPEALLGAVPIEDIINFHIYLTEKTMQLKKKVSVELKKNCYKAILIEDMDGFSRKHTAGTTIDLFKRINTINEANYPEVLKAFFCVNSPMVVSIAYKLVKSFIDPETRKKIFVLGGKFKDELLGLIAEDQILEEYGGKNPIKLKGGGVYSDLKKNGATYNPVNTFVPARDVIEAKITVKEKYAGKATIEYWWTGGDLKFGVAKGTGKEKKEIVASKLIDPATEKNGKVVGSIKVGEGEAGVYVFTFDNSNSWVKSRKLDYHIVVVKPAREEKKKKKKKKEKKEKEDGEEEVEEGKKKKKRDSGEKKD